MEASAQTLAEILDLLDTITEPEFEVCRWNKSEPREIDGKTVYSMPYPDYHPLVELFFQTYFAAFPPGDPYRPLPGDPPGVEPIMVLRKTEDFETATLDQITRFFMLCRRTERFSDGNIEGAIKLGLFKAAATRLRTLEDFRSDAL